MERRSEKKTESEIIAAQDQAVQPNITKRNR